MTFEDYLWQQQLMTKEQLEESMQAAKQSGQRLLCYLAEQEIVPIHSLTKAASDFFALPLFHPREEDWKEAPKEYWIEAIMQSINAAPLKKREDNILDVLIADPSDLATIKLLEFHTGLPICLKLGNYVEIKKAIQKNHAYHTHQKLFNAEPESARSLIKEVSEIAVDDEEPLVHFVNHTIEQAIDQGVSDIHVEIHQDFCRIRFRLDGLLHEYSTLPKAIAPRLIARLKIMARLDISEHRLPQDGRFRFTLQGKVRTMDVRVSTCPTLYGEKIVLRLLHHEQVLRHIDQLHFNAYQQCAFLAALKRPQGLILVTGPTGSGKTVTLYAALNELNTPARNISTVEDPVEINLLGINQVNIHPKAGLTFSKCLRAFLRQDPDVIMVGEMRDLETAEIAIKASQTGHLVLSTLHTNSAIEAFIRLRNMGVPAYNLADSLVLIMAQRLVRKLCPVCKILDDRVSDFKAFRAGSCEKCQGGYRGRIAVHEFLPIEADFSALIFKEASSRDFEKLASEKKMINLKQAALEKVKEGLTSLDEIHRVINFN